MAHSSTRSKHHHVKNLVAFSGGVDSSLVAGRFYFILGCPTQALFVTSASPFNGSIAAQ